MRGEGSPFRNAIMAAPMHLKGIPRRGRTLLFALLCVSLVFLLPRFDLGVDGSRLFSSVRGPPRFDVLQFVDPLIGTANGGKSTMSPSSPRAPSNCGISESHTSISNRPCLSRRDASLWCVPKTRPPVRVCRLIRC